MRALVKTKNAVELQEIVSPAIRSSNDVIIQVVLAGLCRTDVFAAEGKIACKENLVLGHEFSGVVVSAGKDVMHVKPGDKVAVMPVIGCDQCIQCTSGAAGQCQHTTMLGVNHDGAFAEYVVVPAHTVHKMPNRMPFKHGAYIEPVAASLSVIKAGIEKNQKGVIYGQNRFGQLIERILKAYGFKNITIFDPTEGVSAPVDAYDFAVETMATADAMQVIFGMVKPGGRVVIKSRRHDPIGICFNTLVRKELTLCAVNYGSFGEAIRLVADGLIYVDDLLGDIYALEDFESVFEMSRTHESKKIFFMPNKDHVRDC